MLPSLLGLVFSLLLVTTTAFLPLTTAQSSSCPNYAAMAYDSEFPDLVDGWIPNEEGEFLQEPIPLDSIAQSPSDLQVVLAHRFYSPWSAALRAILNYYQVDQRRIVMDLPKKKSLAKSDYKMVPLIVVMDDSAGYQINDSIIIIQTMYSFWTQGRSFQDDVRRHEHKLLSSIPVSIEMSIFDEPNGVAQFARHFSVPESYNPLVKASVKRKWGQRMAQRYEKDPTTLRETMKWFVEHRNGIFWADTDGPGPIDLFLYGYLCIFIAVAEDKKKNKGVVVRNRILDDLAAAGAMDWFQAVDDAYKAKSSEPVIPESAKDAVPRSVYGWW